MGKSKIEWTEHVWNPTRGCSRVSEGCRNCYAERMAARFSGQSQDPRINAPFYSFAEMTKSGPRWTGRVELIESALDIPLKRRKPTTYFVNSMSDLFHENLPDEAIDRVFAVMAVCQRHRFLVLTKRAQRMREYVTAKRHDPNSVSTFSSLVDELYTLNGRDPKLVRSHGVDPLAIGYDLLMGESHKHWPLANVGLGVSVENQETADARIPHLLQTPAAMRFVSYEPALGPVDLGWFIGQDCDECGGRHALANEACECGPGDFRGIDWVICGGESGPGARPAHPDWFRAVRDQCAAAGTAFFFKQWGEWAPSNSDKGMLVDRTEQCGYYCDERAGHVDHGAVVMARVGKKPAGRLLDGREYNARPEGWQ